jgi:hypothetical protein
MTTRTPARKVDRGRQEGGCVRRVLGTGVGVCPHLGNEGKGLLFSLAKAVYLGEQVILLVDQRLSEALRPH